MTRAPASTRHSACGQPLCTTPFASCLGCLPGTALQGPVAAQGDYWCSTATGVSIATLPFRNLP